MSKHVLYGVSERMAYEFNEGMKALDSLEAEIRSIFAALSRMDFSVGQVHRRPLALPTAADHAAADRLARELTGGADV